MTLASHSVVGALVAKAVPGFHPVIQFFFGFISHFLVDAVPHGHYSLGAKQPDPEDPFHAAMPLDKSSLKDFSKIGLDLLIGGAVTFLFLGGFDLRSYLTLAVGAFGGILPDVLQFVYWKTRKTPLGAPLKIIQKFHLKTMHTKILLDKNRLLTYSIEAATILLSVLIGKLV